MFKKLSKNVQDFVSVKIKKDTEEKIISKNIKVEKLLFQTCLEDRIHYYKRNNLDNLLDDSKIQQYIYNLKCIAYDTKMLGIYPIDIHSGNLGSKVVDGDLIYFDIGANKNYSVEPIDSIIIL